MHTHKLVIHSPSLLQRLVLLLQLLPNVHAPSRILQSLVASFFPFLLFLSSLQSKQSSLSLFCIIPLLPLLLQDPILQLLVTPYCVISDRRPSSSEFVTCRSSKSCSRARKAGNVLLLLLLEKIFTTT